MIEAVPDDLSRFVPVSVPSVLSVVIVLVLSLLHAAQGAICREPFSPAKTFSPMPGTRRRSSKDL